MVAQKDINLFPKPVNLVLKEGVFQFSKNTKFVVNNDSQKEIATALISKFGS
jgi:hexosaminidase